MKKYILLLFVMSCSKCVSGPRPDTLELVSISQVKNMDPIFASDLYAGKEVARVYEGLLEYKFLVNPPTLQPNLAESMPTFSEDGLTVTFKIKQGVFFHTNDCFETNPRELVAEDFVYSIKRLADTKLNSTGWWTLENKIVGLDEWRKTSDYQKEIEGLKALDKYTLQFKLVKPYPQFLFTLAMPFTFAVPKEAVDFYKEEFVNHPVGTGPYVLDKLTQQGKIDYYKNPNFREKFYPSTASDEYKHLLQDANKRLPLVDKVTVHIITEDQPRWLNFLQGRLDFIAIPKDNFTTAVSSGKLSKDLENRGINLHITPSLDLTYHAFNHDLPIFKDKRVRQAISLAEDLNETNTLFYNSTAIIAQGVIPPGLGGYDPNFKSPNVGPNISKAKQLLAEAGYPDGVGFPTIIYGSPSGSTTSRQMAELFQKTMKQININVEILNMPFRDLMTDIDTKRSLSMWGIAWSADYPDAETFLQLLYGPNKYPGSNGAGYQNDTYDKLFEKASKMLPSPERDAIYKELNEFLANEVPIVLGVHRTSYTLTNPRLRNYIYSDVNLTTNLYLNIAK